MNVEQYTPRRCPPNSRTGCHPSTWLPAPGGYSRGRRPPLPQTGAAAPRPCTDGVRHAVDAHAADGHIQIHIRQNNVCIRTPLTQGHKVAFGNTIHLKERCHVEITIGVTGMTCDHCVKAVTEEIMGIEDVQNVEVELREGLPSPVTITSTRELAPLEIESAVDEAGYVVV